MRFSTLSTLVSIAVLASAGPIRVARQAAPAPVDPSLTFLVILEEGASGFYSEFSQTFTGPDFQNSGFVNGQAISDVVNTITNSEGNHLAILEAVSGAAPPNCTLDFSPGLTDPITALSTARTLEFLAIGSYVGVLESDTTSNNTELFAEIMGNEARHQTWLNMVTNGDVFPDSFELGMTPAEVLTVLLPFKPSCTPALTLAPNDPLVLTNSGPITNTSTLTFDLSATTCANQTGLFCHLLTGDVSFGAVLPIENCTTEGIDGGALAFVTTDNTPLPSDPVQRSSLPVCAGPAVIFVDPAVQPSLSSLLYQPASASSNSSVSSNSTA